jgi:hypothetical protein
LRELLVSEQIAGRVGDDELVLTFAVADRIRRLILVLDQTDDLELDFAPIRRLDGEGLTQLERVALTGRRTGLTVAVVRVYDGPPVSVQIAFDVCVVFPERLGKCVMPVPLIDVVIVVRPLGVQCA